MMQTLGHLRSNLDPKPTLLGWLVVNISGWLLATLVLFAISRFAVDATSNWLLLGALAAGGAITGLVQWQALRSRYGLSGREWVLATAAGFGLGLWGMVWANLLDLYAWNSLGGPVYEWDGLVGAVLVGLAVGGCQAVVWRGRIRMALLWLLAAGLGWSAGLFLADLGAFLLSDSSAGPGPWLLYFIGPPAVAGLLTWPALSRFSPRTATRPPVPAEAR